MPFWNVKVLAETLYIIEDELGRVLTDLCVGGRFPSPSLIEEHDAVHGRIEVARVGFGSLPAGTTMEEEDCHDISDRHLQTKWILYLAFHPSFHTVNNITYG